MANVSRCLASTNLSGCRGASGRQMLHHPAVLLVALITKPLMKTAFPFPPEFERFRNNPIPAPVPGTRNFFPFIFLLLCLKSANQFRSITDHPALGRSMRFYLVAAGAAGEITIRRLSFQLCNCSANTNLARQFRPIKQQRGKRILFKILSLGTVIVGKKDKTILLDSPEQNDACRWDIVAARGCKCHRIRLGNADLLRVLKPIAELPDRIRIETIKGLRQIVFVTHRKAFFLDGLICEKGSYPFILTGSTSGRFIFMSQPFRQIIIDIDHPLAVENMAGWFKCIRYRSMLPKIEQCGKSQPHPPPLISDQSSAMAT